MLSNLPSFKHRPFRMYLFLGLHIIFASLIIVGSTLPRTATLWVNDVGSLIVNSIVNTLKGVKPVRPERLEIGEYSHKYYSYLFDDDRYKVFVGDSFQMEIKEIFPEGTDESLKEKTVNIKTSKGSDNYFICDYDIGKQNLTIYGKKAASNQFITLSVPSTNRLLTINFDVVDKQVPTKENIYVSNTSPKLGSSFYISSLFLEPYEEDIVKDGYNISKQEDYIRGGVYYNALEKNGLYYSPFSETRFRDALDLSNHHYISDDSNIIIDEENEIVKIGEATSPGEHVITSTYGSSVSFTVLNETCSPLSISELTIESVKDIVCPEQIISSYIGQTIKLGGNELSEHALMVKSNDEGICHAQIKKSLKNGVFAFNNELFIRGNNAGNTSLDVHLLDDPSIKLNNHSILCDTFSNQFNIDVDLLFEGVSYLKQELVNNHDYRLDIIIRHRDTGIEEHPDYVSCTLIANYYSLSKVENGVYNFRFVGSGELSLSFSFRYEGTYCQNRIIFNVVDPTKSELADVDPVSVRKIVGHAFLHLLSTLFLILFFYTYLEPKAKKDKLYILLITGVLAFMLATLSEVIQLFVPERYFGFKDIFIDYLGPTLITLVFLVLIFFYKPKQKEE